MSRAWAVALCTLLCVMTALMGSDWPRVVHPQLSGWPTPRIAEMAQSVVYGCPVPVCLLAAWLLGRVPAQTAVQRRWRTGFIIFALLVGLLPLWGVNRFWFYRLGTPGFMTPFALSVILFPPAWNMAVTSPKEQITVSRTLIIGALLWVAAICVASACIAFPMWPVVIPVPFAAAISLSTGLTSAEFLKRYLCLFGGSTAIALLMRVFMYIMKYNVTPVC